MTTSQIPSNDPKRSPNDHPKGPLMTPKFLFEIFGPGLRKLINGRPRKNPFKHLKNFPPQKKQKSGPVKNKNPDPLKQINAGAQFFTGSTTLPLDRFFQVGANLITYCNS